LRAYLGVSALFDYIKVREFEAVGIDEKLAVWRYADVGDFPFRVCSAQNLAGGRDTVLYWRSRLRRSTHETIRDVVFGCRAV